MPTNQGDNMSTEDMSIITELESLCSIYHDLEEIILKRISKLPHFSGECNCGEPKRFSIVEDDNITTYCLNCGAFINW